MDTDECAFDGDERDVTASPVRSVVLDGIGYRLSRGAKRFRDAMTPALAQVGLHLGQELLLAQLWREDGLLQSEIATRLSSDPATVSRAVSRLATAGMVETRADADDLRTARVYLTVHGRSVRDAVEAAWLSAEREMLTALGPRRYAQLERSLHAYGRLAKGRAKRR